MRRCASFHAKRLLGVCCMLMVSTSSAVGSAYGSHTRNTLLGVPVKLRCMACPMAAVSQKVLWARTKAGKAAGTISPPVVLLNQGLTY